MHPLPLPTRLSLLQALSFVPGARGRGQKFADIMLVDASGTWANLQCETFPLAFPVRENTPLPRYWQIRDEVSRLRKWGVSPGKIASVVGEDRTTVIRAIRTK